MRRFLELFVASAVAASPIAASAQEGRYDDWVVGVSNDRSGLYAATSNDSGSAFAQACDTRGTCEYRLSISVRCEPGARYPVLVNANAGDAGAMMGTMICQGPNPAQTSSTIYTIGPFDDLDRLVRGATRIGFAMPMQSDQFHVARFSLRGSVPALSSMRGAAARAAGQGGGGLRDTRL